MGFGHGSVPVSVSTVGTVFTISFSEVSNLSDKCNQKIIYFTNTVASRCKIIYPEGYTLDSKVYQLTSTSTSDDISAAVGGESGLKAIIQAVNDGNRLVIRGNYEGLTGVINTDVLVNITNMDESNGDMSLSMFFGGVGVQGYLGFQYMLINYTKASNTFSVNTYTFQLNN